MYSPLSWRVCAHELKSRSRNKIGWLLLVIMQLVLLLSLLSGWQQYQLQADQQKLSQELVEQQWLDQPDRHPHRVAHFGHFAFRPPALLSFFDVGINNWVGSSVFLEAHRQNSANFSNDQDQASLLRFSELTPANILLLIWPLLLICLGFSSISGDKRNGTLRQILSMGVTIRQLIVGKFLAYLLLTLVFLLPIFVATLSLSVYSGAASSGEAFIRILLLFVLYTVYSIFWLLLILIVSSVTRIPRQSLGVLLSIWFLLAVLMPRVIDDGGALLSPHQKRVDFNLSIKMAKREVGDSHNPDDPYFNKFRQSVLEKYNVDRVEDLPINYRGVLMQEGEKITANIYIEKYGEQLQRYGEQQQLSRWFYWLNPYLIARDVSMALAASDSQHFFDFEQQAEAHRYQRIQKLNDLHIHDIEHAHDRAQKVSNDYWRTFDVFDYQWPTLARSFSGEFWWGLSTLPIMLLLCVYIRSKRLEKKIYASV